MGRYIRKIILVIILAGGIPDRPRAKAKELPRLQPKGHRVIAAGTVGDEVRSTATHGGGGMKLGGQLNGILAPGNYR